MFLCSVQCNGCATGGFTTAPAPIYGTIEAGKQIKLDRTTRPDPHVCHQKSISPSGARGQLLYGSRLRSPGRPLMANGPLRTAYMQMITFTLSPSRQGFVLANTLSATRSLPCTLEINSLELPWSSIYPSCIQVEVAGNGNDLPTNLVSFPGEYAPTTPGLVYDVYANTGPYLIPSPAVWS
ncbi:hypothetical protein BDN71DRAFT_1238135 [Pleurotus eryngii]|uniref:lytic cellulose monooxygenase (C4-dehydrogenating) n=1 Tax=Pleurotus eryngii TaxID=5323 RepID=A0A9P5ZS23_PLEER|nr:hypothetical protein BDN71DRAFT_1238135 [Pleurotus eryngii]